MIANYEELPDSTRVWIYQSSEPFDESQIAAIKQDISSFIAQWVSHNNALRAHGDLLHERFVILMVDESQAGASGCSIDKSVHFIKALEQKYGRNMFDRMNFSYLQQDHIHTVPRDRFVELYEQGQINNRTLVFDNLVKNKLELETKWVKSLEDSWHARMV
ncbi:MAG: hypothetical protein AAFO94_17155 [Bacteroidota bacterium]